MELFLKDSTPLFPQPAFDTQQNHMEKRERESNPENMTVNPIVKPYAVDLDYPNSSAKQVIQPHSHIQLASIHESHVSQTLGDIFLKHNNPSDALSPPPTPRS